MSCVISKIVTEIGLCNIVEVLQKMKIWRYRKRVKENGIFFCTDRLQFVVGPIDVSSVISKIATEIG